MASQQPSPDQMLARIPIVTKGLLAINITVFALMFLFSWPLSNCAISGYLVTIDMEFYRIISSAFVHNGIMHIFFNMSSLLQLGIDLERQFGSLSFIFLTLWSVILVGVLYCLLSWFLTVVTGYEGYFQTPAVGFSGVLFAFAVIEAFHTRESTRSVFGMFNVPSKIYPFILLILLQVLIPGISFFGHFAGVLFGLSAVFGLVECCLPSTDALSAIEDWRVLACLTGMNSYVRTAGKSLTVGSGLSAWNTLSSGLLYILMTIGQIIYTVFHIIGCPVDSFLRNVSSCWQSLSTCFSESLQRTTNAHRSCASNTTQADVPDPQRHQGPYVSVPTDEEVAFETNPLFKGAGRKLGGRPQTVSPAVEMVKPTAPPIPTKPADVNML